ncbi:MAG TPA: BsuPI-related putative proteinase inhibitor [Actinomycetota bacterium]|nr:BsuPI-related putative proteinase inhibitor [Actinomycetota bacterium]
MSQNDPFEPLRSERVPRVRTPAVAEIQDRAQKIRSRRSALAAAGMVMTVLLGFAVVLRPWNSEIGNFWEGGFAQSTSPGSQGQDEEASPTPGGGSEPESFSGDPENPMAAGTPPTSGPRTGSGQVPDEASTVKRNGLDVGLALPRKEVQQGQPIQMVLQVCNPADREVTVSFPTGQRYDFEMHRSGDPRPVWRWSDDQMFTQSLSSERWFPRECRQYATKTAGESGSRLSSGRYRVVGVLTASSQVRTEPLDLCVGDCRG